MNFLNFFFNLIFTPFDLFHTLIHSNFFQFPLIFWFRNYILYNSVKLLRLDPPTSLFNSFSRLTPFWQFKRAYYYLLKVYTFLFLHIRAQSNQLPPKRKPLSSYLNNTKPSERPTSHHFKTQKREKDEVPWHYIILTY